MYAHIDFTLIRNLHIIIIFYNVSQIAIILYARTLTSSDDYYCIIIIIVMTINSHSFLININYNDIVIQICCYYECELFFHSFFATSSHELIIKIMYISIDTYKTGWSSNRIWPQSNWILKSSSPPLFFSLSTASSNLILIRKLMVRFTFVWSSSLSANTLQNDRFENVWTNKFVIFQTKRMNECCLKSFYIYIIQ